MLRSIYRCNAPGRESARVDLIKHFVVVLHGFLVDDAALGYDARPLDRDPERVGSCVNRTSASRCDADTHQCCMTTGPTLLSCRASDAPRRAFVPHARS